MKRRRKKRRVRSIPTKLWYTNPKKGRRSKGTPYKNWLKYGLTYWVDSVGNKHSVKSYRRYHKLMYDRITTATNEFYTMIADWKSNEEELHKRKQSITWESTKIQSICSDKNTKPNSQLGKMNL